MCVNCSNIATKLSSLVILVQFKHTPTKEVTKLISKRKASNACGTSHEIVSYWATRRLHHLFNGKTVGGRAISIPKHPTQVPDFARMSLKGRQVSVDKS